MVPLLAATLALPAAPAAQKERPPHGQDTVPGPALSPQEAIRRMTVPPGFAVELVASEPDIVNPVAMTFDERGRIWITESLEYPRQSAGPGRDRIKILESTKGDGKYDKITVFAEGLNIPSGIAVGHGGVWVANSPDILFYKVGPDGKAAGKPEVVVSGFGRTDTHELPNSLTWGPDGWLYGLNGVFNHSHVKQRGKDFVFTCALFRIHPKTREFQLFCEGTSNPWGVAWDGEGSAFVSACVIDHLWHLTETGYYHRQGGPYPPFTWELGSIVKHRHQKAAYCGLHYFDSDAYPPEYRGQLYMGNIHGGCVNCDELTRDGSTYFAKPRPDFLTAHDQWFMPVAQKTGPDGCLYVLDWYDRYHCYQDAQRDPRGIDRLRGRLYRVVYKGHKAAGKFDLGKESDEKLIERLHSPNVYYRDTAQRLLCERLREPHRDEYGRVWKFAGLNEVLAQQLEKLALSGKAPRKARMHALWALVGAGAVAPDFHQKLLSHADAGFRAWGVRAAGNLGKVEPALRDKVVALAEDRSPDVQLQVAIAARKLEGVQPLPVLLRVLGACGDDKLIPHIVWQNLHPLLEDRADRFLEVVAEKRLERAPNVARLMPRVVDRILARRRTEPALVLSLFTTLIEGPGANPNAARQCLAVLASKVQTGEVKPAEAEALRRRFEPALHKLMKDESAGPLRLEAAVLATTLHDPAGVGVVRQAFAAPKETQRMRLRALEALVSVRDPDVLGAAAAVLADRGPQTQNFRAAVLAALGKLDEPRIAAVVLAEYPKMEPDLRPRAVELLTQRGDWGRQLVRAVADKKVPADALNVNQVKRLLAVKDPALVKQVKELWGTVREGRNPEREKVVADMAKFLRGQRGDSRAGAAVFKNLCAQCHKIYGEGQDVGPDLTGNGRASFEQLLSNVFDPSLVIGPGYQATSVTTTQGRVLTGLLVEDNTRRVVLKTQGGKLETVPRDQVEELTVSPLSLMPEGIEKQLKPQEIADLFAFLTLDKPPDDPTAKRIPGTPK
jgi:putative membrane-bound dehydrogenase-like protein